MYIVEKQFVFKNKRFRKLCVSSMIIAFAVAVAFVLLSIINYSSCMNYPRLYCRIGLTLFFALETALFAHRNSIYMEIGGDFALARRSSSLMILTMIISAIVEAYYISAAVVDSGTTRAIYMLIILAVGCAATLPIIQFQYMNLEFGFMQILVLAGMLASLASFMMGFFFIGVNEIKMYEAQGVLQLISRIIDSLSPLYLINFLNGIIILTMAHIALQKEERKTAKSMPENLAVDQLAEEVKERYDTSRENVEVIDQEAEEEFNGL